MSWVIYDFSHMFICLLWNGVYLSSHSSPTKVKEEKNQMKCVQKSIEQAFIKIKK